MTEIADCISLCRLDEIEVPGSRGLTVACGEDLHDIFLVRSVTGVFGYLNRCPHTGAPLDWMPDRFLSLDAKYIQCSTHAALFNRHDGLCIAGPCSGDKLIPVPLVVDSGAVFLMQREFCLRQLPAG